MLLPAQKKNAQERLWKMLDINEKVEELRKAIFTLEWDIPQLHNKEVRLSKEKRLGGYKKELQEILGRGKN